MIGERHTVLCNDCANKFHAWMIGQDAFQEHRNLCAIRAYLDGLCTSGQQVSDIDWINYQALQDHNDDKLFRITGVWLEENKRVEEPKDEEEAKP